MLATALLLLLSFSVKAQTRTFLTSGTFTVPSGVTSINVECWGAGAGGNNNINRGGGGGAFAGINAYGVTPGTSYTITVGTGAAPGTGDDGQNSSFDLLVVAAGGNGPDGGSIAGSTGPIKFAGGNGGLSTGNGGAGGGGSAGAGGAGGDGNNNTNGNGVAGGFPGIPGSGSSGAAGGDGGQNNNDGVTGNSPGGGGGEKGEHGGQSGGGGNGLVIITWTIPASYCPGNASTLVSQFGTGVDNANNSIGPPDNAFATLFDHNGGFVVQLDHLLTSGETIDILWRRNGVTLNNPQVRVDFSIDGLTWTTGVSHTETSLTWVTQNIVLPINTRYIRFWETNEYNIDIDAITYYTAEVGTPTAISVSAGTEPTCELTNATTTTTYSTTATNNTGFNWSRSNNLAGNINATTGVMTWANGFSGSVDIEVTANGCNGPTSPPVKRTVTVNPSPTITGSLSVCGVGATAQLIGSGTATSWFSATPTIATVDGAGLVSGVAVGTSVITYTDNKGCSTNETITVGLLPTTTGITICPGGTGALTSSFTCSAGIPGINVLKNARSGTENNSIGTGSWINHAFITTAGNPYAYQDLTHNETSHYLRGSDYDFAIPVGAIIVGITVTINRQSSGITAPFIQDQRVSLVKAGIIQATNKAATGIDWTNGGVFGTATYGGGADLWGTTWTPAEINDLNFGVVLSATNNNNTRSRTATVDYMQINVSYTLPGTLNWYTVSTGGTSIFSGSPFNPVGVPNSGLANTTTAGTTTFYAECSTAPGCRTATNFIIKPLPAAAGAITGNSAVCLGAIGETYSIPADANADSYVWSYSGTGATITGSTNSVTIDFSAIATLGTLTVKGKNSCGEGVPANLNITITPNVSTPVFTSGATSTRYQIAESLPYTATATYSTEIKYSLDALSKAGGNSIDAGTGVVTYDKTWSGTSTITATAKGCNGPTTETHAVRTNWCFALFAGVGAIHNDLASVVTGDIGTNAGAVDGFSGSPEGTLIGQCHIADATTLQAKTDLNNLYAALDAKPCGTTLGNILGNNQILTPGVYCINPPASSLNGDLFLDAQLNPNAVFIIKVGGALSTAALSKVILQNGASEKNVFWLIDGAVSLGASSLFQGTFIGTGAINLTAGSTLVGRGLTKVGAISLSNCTVNSICAPFTCMSDNVPPTFAAATGPFEFCVENLISAAYVSNTLQINADADCYLFKKDNTIFDLDPLKFTDNCCVSTAPFPLNIRWTIEFSTGQPDISGIGQPSKYGSDIQLWGDGVNFNPVVHKITWWIKDCSGNESLPQSQTITIKPRPKFL